MVTITISLRKDENEKVDAFAKDHGLNRHTTIKYAVRRFFFPNEDPVPVNGMVPVLDPAGAAKHHSIIDEVVEDIFSAVSGKPTARDLEARAKRAKAEAALEAFCKKCYLEGKA